MKALVTGGAGFIGSHIVDALIARDYEVRVLDNLELSAHPQGCPGYLDRRIRLLKGDMRDRAAMESALEGVDVVFHQADHKGHTSDYAKFFHSNVVSTALLFEIIREKRLPVRKVVVASAQAVYGEGQYYCATHGLVLPEPRSSEQLEQGKWENECEECHGALVPVLLREGRTNPGSPYGISKMAQEQAAFRLGKLLGIPVVVLRYSHVEGPRQSVWTAFSGICGSFALGLQNGKPAAIFEDGKQLRDYVHVADVTEANMLALDNAGADGEAFNVGSGRGTTDIDLVGVLMQKTNTQLSFETPGAYRAGDARHAISSISQLQALGWKPKKGLNEIVDDYLNWLGGGIELSKRQTEGADEAASVATGEQGAQHEVHANQLRIMGLDVIRGAAVGWRMKS